MKIMKTSMILLCAGFVASPAYSQTQAKQPVANSTTPNTITTNGVTFNPDNPGDTRQIKINKKAYMQQVEQAFDKLDTNGDGVIDSQEIESRRTNSRTGARKEFDEDPGDIAYKSSGKNAASGTGGAGTMSPLNSIPPVNSKDIIKK